MVIKVSVSIQNAYGTTQFECKSCESTHKALTPNKNTRNKQSHQTVNKVSKTSEQVALEVFEEKKNLSNRFSDSLKCILNYLSNCISDKMPGVKIKSYILHYFILKFLRDLDVSRRILRSFRHLQKTMKSRLFIAVV